MKLSRIIDGGEPLPPISPEPIESTQCNGYLVEIFANGEKQIQLEKFAAKFRPPTGKEVINAMKMSKNSNAHQNRLLAMSCCVQWGEKKQLLLNDLSDLRIAEHYAITNLLESFVQESAFQLEEQEDYSILMIFDDSFTCKFRDLKGEEAEFIETTFDKFSSIQDGRKIPTIEAFGKIAARLCVQWDSETKATESQILDRPVSNLIAIGRAITENFLQRST